MQNETSINVPKTNVIKFGTDGWRGIIAKDFTFDNVRAVSQAIADYGQEVVPREEKRRLKVVVGYDTRFLSAEFAETVSCVLAANDIEVILSERPLTTPMVSFAIKNKGYDLGVVITASHNPAAYNGLKIKNSRGGAADVSVTKKVEANLFRNKIKILTPEEARVKGLIKLDDLVPDYINFIRSYIDMKVLKKARFKVLVDVMHGSGNGYLDKILEKTSLQISLMRSDINPSFEGKRPEPIEPNLETIIHRMKKERFDIGLVLDGDADRIAAVAPGGEFISPQKILSLLILHLIEDRHWSGAVVKTIVGTTLIDRIVEKLNLQVFETPVGFKYISKLMQEEDIVIGGEEAGGIGFKNYIPERDGILAGILILEMLASRRAGINKLLASLNKEYGRFFYEKTEKEITKTKFRDIKNLRIPKRLLNKKVIEVKDFDGVKIICEDSSWLMLRLSGTEPIIRIYSEANTKQKARELIEIGKKMIRT
ncbi:MAG: phosphoglucomutase/phosphomannomutase family protein [Candidatus Omnitrophota bacterium]